MEQKVIPKLRKEKVLIVFKRAAFNFGIGRELYTSPFIWIPSSKGSKTNKFYVSNIDYNDKNEINKLTIVNKNTKSVVFTFDTDKSIENLNQSNTNEKQSIPTFTSIYKNTTKSDKCGADIEAKVANYSTNKFEKNYVGHARRGVNK